MNGTILNGDSLKMLKTLGDKSVQTCVTSPPYYGLRDYGVDGQIGLEETPEEYIQRLVEVFREVKRVLKDDGTLWVNIGDTYSSTLNHGNRNNEDFKDWKQSTNKGSTSIDYTKFSLSNMGLKPKDLIGIPWMLAFALRADGWYLRQDIIWHKPNPMPESVTDRCTKSHEYIFLLSKSKKYYFDHEAIKEKSVQGDSKVRDRDKPNAKFNNTPGRTRMAGLTRNDYPKRNKRDVWNVAVIPFKGAHFATFPKALIEPCILAGCPAGGTVLDTFFGAGTVGVVATENNRKYIGVELNEEYCDIAKKRIENPEILRGGAKPKKRSIDCDGQMKLDI